MLSFGREQSVLRLRIVTAGSTYPGPSKQRRPSYPQRSWTVHLRKPVRTPSDGWPFVQLPPGEYTLHERSDVHYELRVSDDFSCYFRLSELEAMREGEEIHIEGRWP